MTTDIENKFIGNIACGDIIAYKPVNNVYENNIVERALGIVVFKANNNIGIFTKLNRALHRYPYTYGDVPPNLIYQEIVPELILEKIET
jgi:hypothetical protein